MAARSLLRCTAALALSIVTACGDDAGTGDAGHPRDASVDTTPGQPAALAIDLPMVPFGSVDVGATSPATVVTVTNAGGQATGALTVAIDGTDAASFATTATTCAAALGPGATCTVSVVFAPSVGGGHGATLTVSGSPGGHVTAMLTGVGRGVGPGALSITSDANMLGSALVGGFGELTATFTVTNVGGDATGPLALQPSGANPADFIFDDQCATRSLAPNDTCTIVARVAPTAPGARTAALEVSAVPGGLVAGAVSGIGLAPAHVATAFYARDLGAVAIGATTSTTLTYTNTGDVPTGAITATFTGGDFATAGGTCIGAVLAPGASCTVGVQLSSATAGATTSSVSVNARPGVDHELVTIVDAEVTPAAQLTIAPSAIEVASTALAATSGPQTLTITNHAPSATGTLVVASSHPASFPITADTCTGKSLAAGASCTLTVAFAPVAATPLATRIRVSSPSAGAVAASLAGVGLAPAKLVLSRDTQRFGAVATGASSDATLTLTNAGGQPSGVPALAVTGGAAVAYTPTSTCTAPLAAGASCTVAVRFTPSAAADASATLAATASPGGAATTALVGAGVASGGLVVSPSHFEPAPTAVTFASSPQAFSVRNTGTAAITDLAVTSDAAFPLATGVGTRCGAALAAGASCVVTAAFAPATVGALAGAITASGGGTSASAALAGTSIPLFEMVAVDSVPGPATSYDFGTQPIGGTPAADAFVTVALHSSPADFLLTSEQFGAPAQFRTIGNTCSSNLNKFPCTLRLRFTPTSAGPKSGSLSIRGSQFLDGTGKQVAIPFSLTGTGGSP